MFIEPIQSILAIIVVLKFIETWWWFVQTGWADYERGTEEEI